jgi:uncharacterized membrane protein YkgB
MTVSYGQILVLSAILTTPPLFVPNASQADICNNLISIVIVIKELTMMALTLVVLYNNNKYQAINNRVEMTKQAISIRTEMAQQTIVCLLGV